MPQKNIYNEIPGDSAEKAAIAGDVTAQSKTEATNSETSNTTGNNASAPAAHDAGGVNVTRKGKKTTKEVNFKNLEGDLEITPTPKNFRIVAGMTVRIVGVGKFLSGFYYVMSKTVGISGNGAMTIKLSVIKTNFGDSLKGEAPINIETTDLIGDKQTKGKSKVSEAIDLQGNYSQDWSTYPDGTNNSSHSSDDYERSSSDDRVNVQTRG